MKELKFRAWDTKYKGWCTHFVIDNYGNAHSIFGTISSIEDNQRYWKEHVVIMQFTGLYDRHGKEIYDGDIVKFSGYYFGDTYEKESVEAVYWNHKEKSYSYNFQNIGFQEGPTWCEVIGNIFDNPELMKEE